MLGTEEDMRWRVEVRGVEVRTVVNAFERALIQSL